MKSRLELAYLLEMFVLQLYKICPCRYLQSWRESMLLFSGSGNDSVFYAKINRPDKKKKLSILGLEDDHFTSELDDDTADALR